MIKVLQHKTRAPDNLVPQVSYEVIGATTTEKIMEKVIVGDFLLDWDLERLKKNHEVVIVN